MKVARGTRTAFETDFIDPAGDALVRADPASTPTVQIKTPGGEVLSVGVGSPISTKTYRYEWYCPTDVVLNVPEEKYRVEWYFLILGGNTVTSFEEFDVIDKVEPTPEEKEEYYLSLPGDQERLFFRTTQDPFLSGGELELKVIQKGNILVKVSEVSTDKNKLDKTDPNRAIGKMEKDGQYVFWYDTPPLSMGEYDVFWSLRETAVSSTENHHQMIRIPPWSYWSLNKSLRIVIDRLQKRMDWVQGYSDSSIFEFILAGLGMVNSTMPNTNWQIDTIPTMIDASSGVADAVITAAAMKALTSQQALEIELSFSHGGQTVTLEYNHDYGGVLSNLESMFNRFVEAKPRLYRVACGPGVVGVRLAHNRSWGQRVFKLHSDYTDEDWYNPTSLIASVFT